jgi:hypothetical protein
MTGQEKGDCLIEVTTWAGLTVFVFYPESSLYNNKVIICKKKKIVLPCHYA